MKSRIFFAFVLIIGLFCEFFSFSQEKNQDFLTENSDENLSEIFSPSGTELSNSVYDFLISSSFNPEIQELVNSGTNDFPYNIILNINEKDYALSEKELFNQKRVIYVISQTDAFLNKNLILNFCNYCKESALPVTILFSYGTKLQTFDDFPDFSTTQVFINTLSPDSDVTAIILEFGGPQNIIISSSNGKTSPSWLVQTLYNLAIKSTLSFATPPYYLSQMHKFKFSQDTGIEEFFKLNIPCAKISFKNRTKDFKSVNYFLKELTASFDENSPMEFDQHFFILNILGKKFITISESFIVYAVLFSILASLLFSSLTFFIDHKRKINSIFNLKYNWHALPVTFLIVLLCLVLGKGFSVVIKTNLNTLSKIFLSYTIQAFFAIIACGLFFIAEVYRNKNLNEKTISYLVLISSFFNQFIFLYADISLFPIFFVVCLLAIAALYIKNNAVHVLIFLLMCLPFYIYVRLLINYSQISELKNYLLSSSSIIFAISFVSLPLFLEIFRIYIQFSRKIKKSKLKIIIPSAFASFVFITILFTGLIHISVITNEQRQTQNIEIQKAEDRDIAVFTIDDFLFEDIVRTLEITIPQNTIQCLVKVSCEKESDSTPILYSDNSFATTSETSAYFIIPKNPPEKMKFTYGTKDFPTTIKISCIYKGKNPNQFIMQEKTVKID